MKSGFVSVVGRPNVGKSTLVNQIVGRKVSIVSYKPQTTRDVIKGIYNDEDSQIVFTDTPGIHKSEDKLGEIMNENATSASNDCEVILMLIDASKESQASDKYVFEKIKKNASPKILVINKIDAISKERLIQLLTYYANMEMFSDIIPISALKNDNITHLIQLIKSKLPEGPQYFPVHMVSDHAEQFLISEIIREKILLLTDEEVPYSIGVYCESVIEKETNYLIKAVVLVNRDSQKGIIIGDGGKMLGKITRQASDDLKKQLKKNIRLEIYVKAYKNWRNNARLLKMLGYQVE